MSSDTGYKYWQNTQFITKHKLIYLSKLRMIISTVAMIENNITAFLYSRVTRIVEACAIQMYTLYLEC